MYFAIILVLGAISVGLILYGINSKKLAATVTGAIVAAVSIAVFSLLDIWGEYLWFDAVGFAQRFRISITAKILITLAGFAAGFIYVFLLNAFHKGSVTIKLIGAVIAAVIGAQWGFNNWDTVLLYLNRVSTQAADPILKMPISFYLFNLPFYEALYSFLTSITVISLAVLLASRLLQVNISEQDIQMRQINFRQDLTAGYFRNMFINVGILFLLVSAGRVLARYNLMYSGLGAVHGVGWTDDHIRMPVYSILAVMTALFGLILIFSPASAAIKAISGRFKASYIVSPFAYVGCFVVITAAVWFIGASILPGVFQWLRVEPNEITFERPYIANNIQYTRKAFNLDTVEERKFPASGQLTQQMLDNNQTILKNIRLWDWRALDSVYKQFQEIRLYYEFVDVDIDRYMINGDYRQTMVSAREMQTGNLPAQSQTFVNKRFKYTHGYGLTLTTVSEFTPQGLPNLLIKDIPPKSKYESLEIDTPQIYYGELTDSHVIVNSEEKEFDYPSGEENNYSRYQGTGGVQINSLWRKFIFGWKFDGTRLFVSKYPSKESRIQFHRQIKERVRTLAPFLQYDDDPYVVLNNGRMYWIVDCYTTTSDYPYSEPVYVSGQYAVSRGISSKDAPYQFDGINYIRNSVKAVIDAYHGTVDFYVFDPEDPIIQTWQNVFPNMFKSRDEMPDELFKHVRYPSDMLLMQGLVYAKYHMTDPTVFYNQEDLWVRATEKYYNNVQPVQPYYIIWEMPGSNEPEFVLMMPFTPKNRQVLIGWIAGMCDGENYGRFLAYKFPKEKRILGTQQMETKIDQDSFLSGQLSLWDQRGSNVIRGNVLVIPLEETLLYVEPIYLQAETAAYPELRLVAVMHEDDLSYAETFDEAIQGLLSPQDQKKPAIKDALTGNTAQLADKANKAFEDYLEATGQGSFDEASRHLSDLQEYLRRLMKGTGKIEPGEED